MAEENVSDTKLILTISCPDGPGIVHAVSNIIVENQGNIIQSQQFGDPDTGLFFMRVELECPAGRAPIEVGMEEFAKRFDAVWNLDLYGRPLRTIIKIGRAHV